MRQKSYNNEKGNLYIVPTPIGNMEDITFRAINILKEVDYILCEDTRTSKIILDYYKINNKLFSCHEYNEDKIKEKVFCDLNKGMNLAIVTDQGTPIVSDPGYKVVKYVTNLGGTVISLPGATAFTPALTNSGIDPSHFMFYGFLNAKKSKRIEELKSLEKYPFTMIFYESVHRCLDTLNDMLNILGDRDISISRELSKLYEEVYRGKISDIINELDTLKGEFVIVASGNKETIDYSSLTVSEHVNLYLDECGSVNDAIKKVAKERGVPKSLIYKEYHGGKQYEINSRVR